MLIEEKGQNENKINFFNYQKRFQGWKRYKKGNLQINKDKKKSKKNQAILRPVFRSSSTNYIKKNICLTVF